MSSITAFTPPASCFAPTYTVSPLGNDVVGNLTAIRGYASECMPFTPEPTGGYPTMPAVQCLAGYELQSDMSTNGASTYGTCCPSGMAVQSTSTQMCSSVTGYNSVAVVDGTQTTSVHANFLYAPALVMAWSSGQVPLTTPTSPSAGPPAFIPESASTVAMLPRPTSTLDAVNDTAGHIRNTVVLAICIAVGCFVGLGLLFGVVAFVLWRKRQQQKRARGHVEQDLPPAYEARMSQSSEGLPQYVAGSKSETVDTK